MISILYQNNDFIVVNKPAGVNFHSEELPGLVVLVQQQLNLSEIYPVHRLDKMTSGLLILALNKPTAQRFQRMFENHLVEKFYIAISDQKPKKKQGWIKGDMVAARRGSWMLTKTQTNPAVTQFISALIHPGERLFLLKPKTGKTHQLRVAMKSLSAPICGDARYGDANRAKLEDRGYLHAYAIRFELQQTPYEFICQPDEGQRFLQADCQKLLKAWQTPWTYFK
ncbi:RNA pseudouridine synthase [Thiomicrorhabdus immobilis]|uniref:RNA pseudouridine synthase n=1 Tax=Thiomicrorhabdus immobilis TaxID=2791037 RepID=A0ABM7MDI8_9GAMM|nr:TIGR01621 family pseudouridine synthase [Thiomicrorhabdus immobilis]BCN93489.1 RNA pseudouridine synthase [Thiomicrorhabdus immobilis]